jgi:hypothetical protein
MELSIGTMNRRLCPKRYRSKSRLGSMHILNQVFYIGFKVLTAVVMKSSIFCDTTPCSPLIVNILFRRHMSPPSSGSRTKLCLPPTFTLVSFAAYSSTLRMEEICSFESSVNFQLIISQKIVLFNYFVSLICSPKAWRV